MQENYPQDTIVPSSVLFSKPKPHSTNGNATMNLPKLHTPFGVAASRFSKKPIAIMGLNILPDALYSTHISIILNFFLEKAIGRGQFSEIVNKRINVHIRDINKTICFIARDKFIETSKDTQNSDACISLTLDGAKSIIFQESDPDTLFFKRELMVTGNTEVGLALKNILDSIDMEEIFPKWLKSRHILVPKGEIDKSLP